MTIQLRTTITFHTTYRYKTRIAHFLSRSIISSLWWAVVAVASVELKIGCVYFAL